MSIWRDVSAWDSPFCVRTEKFELPWIRPSSFHVLCPCLTRTTLLATLIGGKGIELYSSVLNSLATSEFADLSISCKLEDDWIVKAELHLRLLHVWEKLAFLCAKEWTWPMRGATESILPLYQRYGFSICFSCFLRFALILNLCFRNFRRIRDTRTKWHVVWAIYCRANSSSQEARTRGKAQLRTAGPSPTPGKNLNKMFRKP